MEGSGASQHSTSESGTGGTPATGSALCGFDLFSGLDAAALADIERACSRKRFAPQEQIIDRDSRSRDVCFVLSGRARVVNYSLSGREITFDDILSGSYFGELAAIDGRPRSASVMAVEETVIAQLSHQVFMDILAKHPKVALHVMERLARIIRSADERIMDLSTLAAQNRVQGELLRQAHNSMVDATTARITPIPLHADIASRVSTTRETVARVLNDLARAGIVKRTKGALLILDVPELEAMVQDMHG
ncbi:MAG: Crp/Fnr family transcriptional regulator [Rhodospirillales bacterium]|nr:MAG: Crp/Fnr family transcriptional regulator [Rhodospirillales bacterium]